MEKLIKGASAIITDITEHSSSILTEINLIEKYQKTEEVSWVRQVEDESQVPDKHTRIGNGLTPVREIVYSERDADRKRYFIGAGIVWIFLIIMAIVGLTGGGALLQAGLGGIIFILILAYLLTQPMRRSTPSTRTRKEIRRYLEEILQNKK